MTTHPPTAAGSSSTAGEERALVERYLSTRDEASFGALYRRHTPALYRLALGLTGEPDRAADAVQETWLRAMRRLDSFRWSSPLRTWLCGIVVNCCRESWRHRATGDLSPLPSVEPPGDQVDLLRALRALPDRARAVLVLHEVLGHTHAEIGRLLDIDEGTSKSQLHYSRLRLRQWFDARQEQGGRRHARS